MADVVSLPELRSNRAFKDIRTVAQDGLAKLQALNLFNLSPKKYRTVICKVSEFKTILAVTDPAVLAELERHIELEDRELSQAEVLAVAIGLRPEFFKITVS